MEDTKILLLQAIRAYVPEQVVERLVANPGCDLVDWEERCDAALLFADVSGFTAMSESLARVGKEGAEELTRVLNDYFTVMIEQVEHYDGQVIKFGGDAITCAFLKRAGEPPAILRACACALAMQEGMDQFRAVETRGGAFALHMKIGIGAGTVLFLSIGDPQRGQEFLLAGQPLERMAEAEHHASAGEVVIAGECLATAGATELLLGEERAGFWSVLGLRRAVERTVRTEIDLRGLSSAVLDCIITQLVPYLPPTVYERIAGGQRQFVGEHRHVVSLFVNFAGLDYEGDPQAGQKLQQYFVTVQGLVLRYGGRLNRVSVGDKGNLLHIIFGAPIAYEDNEERAVGCALALQKQLAESPAPIATDQRIGVASGYVFAGDVGSERRREYTVMGDVVNLSARLMQASRAGEILTDWHTARRVEGGILCQELPAIQVKGKQEPVPVCLALGVRQDVRHWQDESRSGRHHLPMVGRREELADVEQIIARVVDGHGQLLVISGEAGVGKSRFLEEIVRLARDQGSQVLGGDCLSYGSQSPYLPWLGLFNTLFGLVAAETASGTEKVAHIERKMVETDPALDDWVPLMAQLLGLPVPDNALTAALDAQLRRQRTFDITLALLRQQAQQAPLLLVFEDVHWIDSISLEMLNYVARNVANHRILLVVLHRPTIELSDWRDYSHYHHIALNDLSTEDALALVRARLGMAELPQALQERVLRGEERVNPFFVEEMLNSLVDRGYLVRQPDGPGYRLVGDLSGLTMPDSIQALVMSRIDRLDESSKLTIKVASAIGRVFRYRALLGIYPVDVQPQQLRENLDRLSQLDLTPLDRPAPEWEYIFKHVTTQEVAYESLLYKHRRELHGRMGQYLEQTYPTSLEEYLELLAYHYSRSGDADKSWEYLVKAGDKAREKYANEAAIAHYTQALSLDVSRDTSPVWKALADVYRLIGQYEHALEGYQRALDQPGLAPTQVANLQRKIARTLEQKGQYDEAMHYLERARATLSGQLATAELARVCSSMAWVVQQRGSYEEALQLCKRGMTIADGLPPGEESKGVQDELQHTLATIYWRNGDYGRAIHHFQASIEMRKSRGDLYRLIRSYNNLAIVYWNQSDFGAAADYLLKSLETSQRIGDAYGTAMCFSNLGVISYTLGRYEQAIEYYHKSLAIRQEIGDAQGIADVYSNLGEVHHALGNHQHALRYLGEAIRIFSSIGNEEALFEPYRLLAEVSLELGDTMSALGYCHRALDVAQEMGDREYEGIARRVLGQIHRAAGRLEEAEQSLRQSVETLAAMENKLELGRSEYEWGLALLALGRAEGRGALENAIRIFGQLGLEGELDKARAALPRG